MKKIKLLLIVAVSFFACTTFAQELTGSLTEYFRAARIGIDGVVVPQVRLQIGNEIDRVLVDKNNRRVGAGYISFNNYFRNQGPTYPWYRKGDGTHNGGAIITATKLGDMQFYPVNSTGGGAATVNDDDMPDRMVLKISHNNTNGGNGYVQVNDGYKAVHLGECSGYPFDGNGYIGFNVQKDEASNRWKTGSNGARNGGNVVYSTLTGTFVVSALGNTGGGLAQFTDDEVKENAVLTVNKDGLLRTKEIEVLVDLWSDFVFEEDYDLRPLKEVEMFINTNNHLPDVPSESEVLEHGINLGEMDAILLRKIEELTLYTLQQEKMIQALMEQLEK